MGLCSLFLTFVLRSLIISKRFMRYCLCETFPWDCIISFDNYASLDGAFLLLLLVKSIDFESWFPPPFYDFFVLVGELIIGGNCKFLPWLSDGSFVLPSHTWDKSEPKSKYFVPRNCVSMKLYFLYGSSSKLWFVSFMGEVTLCSYLVMDSSTWFSDILCKSEVSSMYWIISSFDGFLTRF